MLCFWLLNNGSDHDNKIQFSSIDDVIFCVLAMCLFYFDNFALLLSHFVWKFASYTRLLILLCMLFIPNILAIIHSLFLCLFASSLLASLHLFINAKHGELLLPRSRPMRNIFIEKTNYNLTWLSLIQHTCLCTYFHTNCTDQVVLKL